MVWRVPVEAVKKYELKPQYQPFSGHGRSLMFVPTGFGMAPSETEYRNIALGINIFAFGITEHLSAGVGMVSILPYGDLKWSQDFGKYVHWSVGGYVFVPFSVGYHTSLSLGTPDYFLNLNYLRNFDIKPFDSYSDFESFSFGASIRAGRRSRIFAEYNIMVAPKDEEGFGYESFYSTGYGNYFSWGYGWYKRRLRFETGIMGIGPFETYCFPQGSCPAFYHAPAPFFSFSVKF